MKKISMLDRLLASERAKVIAVVLIVAVGTAVTAKNVISYPTECITEEMAHIIQQHKNPEDPA